MASSTQAASQKLTSTPTSLQCSNQLVELMHSRARRRFSRGLKRKPMALIKKLRKAKKEAPPNEKPEIVKTHLRNMIIVPEMTGSIIGVYNGKDFGQVRERKRANLQLMPLLKHCSLRRSKLSLK